MVLTRSDVIIIDATVITGILVLLTLSTISDVDLDTSDYLLASSDLLVTVGVFTTIVAFIASAVKEITTELRIKRIVVNNQDYKEYLRKNLMEDRSHATRLGLQYMAVGFLYLLIVILMIVAVKIAISF